MQAAGLDLNMVTMSALILAIGLLVDDGIVVLENIHRHMNEAAADGARRRGGASARSRRQAGGS
jgi:multidrug efflux pump subunit AcrB